MDDEELKRLIDEFELSTGERSPLRDVLEAKRGENQDLQNLVAPMPELPLDPELIAPPPERKFEPAIIDRPVVEEPESFISPPPETVTPDEAILTGPAKALQALLPVWKKATPAVHGFAEDFARQVTQESMKAAAGDPTFRAEVPFQAAQLAVNPTAGLMIAVGEKGVPAVHETLESLKTPGLLLPPPTKPFSFATQAYAAPGEPELPVAGPNESYGSYSQRMSKYEADLAAWQGRGLPQAVKPPEPPTDKRPMPTGMPEGLTPTASRILNTVGGPQEVSQADFTGMGILGTATLGMALAPYVIRGLRFGATPRMRTVKDAAPGTMDISMPRDLFRTYDDVSKGVVQISARAGAAPDDVAKLEEAYRLQGRAQVIALGDSAVMEGRFETPSYRFQAPTSLAKLEAARTPQTDQYLLLRDTWDEINRLSQTKAFKPSTANPAPGPATVSGMTLDDVNQAMFALERSNPEVKAYSKTYNKYLDEVRKFEADGEYKIRPVKQTTKDPEIEDRSLEYLRAQRANEVPFRGERDIGIPLVEREGPISALAAYTRKAIKAKLDNELVGLSVDTIKKGNAALFTEISSAERTANTRWDKNTVGFYRDGSRVYHTTSPFLADVLKMDRIQFSGPWATALYATKNLLEFGTTRYGAPAFAPVNLLRSWQIGKYTVEQGRRSAGLAGSLYAIPQQLIPQMARAFSDGLKTGSGQWLTQQFPKQHIDALSRRLAYEADKSLYYQLKSFGDTRGGIYLDPQQVSATALTKIKQITDSPWMKAAPAPFKMFWNSYKATLEAIHNGPAHAYVAKNLARPSLPTRAVHAAVGNKLQQGSLRDLYLEGRRMTGDPRTQGQYYTRGNQGRLSPIRLESDSKITQGAVKLLRGYGWTTAALQEGAPWFNATMQGAKRIGEAYLKNPIKFTSRMWMYAMAPAAAEYLYTFQLGKDPNGVSYIDHMLNRRSAYNRQMNWYLPIYGRPAEEGMEIPFFHELAPFKRIMEIGMDHMLRTDRHKMERTLAQEYWNGMWAFMETAVIPPMPPVLNLPLVGAGLQPLQGVWGGEAYKSKENPFDQTGGMASSIETLGRTLAGGIGHTMGQMYASYAQTPEGFAEGLKNAAKAGVRVQVQKTPFLRDAMGVLPTITGNTEISKELFEKQKEINRLTKYIEKWDLGGKYQGPGEINVHPPSKGGGDVMNWLSGPAFTEQSPGLDQPQPTNKLYLHFMDQVRARFRKESPLPNKQGEDEGGIAFKSMWARYGDATEKLSRLRNINEGNSVTWQKTLDKHPEARQEMIDGGVDPTNVRQARNFYERKRHDSARIILYTVRAVEHDMTRQIAANPQLAAQLGWDGKPITLDKLDPYARGGTTGGVRKFIEDIADPSQFIFPELLPGNRPQG